MAEVRTVTVGEVMRHAQRLGRNATLRDIVVAIASEQERESRARAPIGPLGLCALGGATWFAFRWWRRRHARTD